MELAGIGHDDGGPEAGEIPADPRAVRPGFERHGGGRILGEQQGQGRAVIEHWPFVEDLARGIEHTDVMAAIAEVQPDGEAADDGSG